MIGPADRMDEAVREAAGGAGAGVREGRAGQNKESGDRGRDVPDEESHGSALYSGAGAPNKTELARPRASGEF